MNIPMNQFRHLSVCLPLHIVQQMPEGQTVIEHDTNQPVTRMRTELDPRTRPNDRSNL